MKKLLLVPLSLMASLSAIASPVSERQAAATAQKFLSSHGISMGTAAKASAKKKSPAKGAASAAWYAFNGDGQGFVIVSGDDRTVPVLGYSLTGTFDYDSAPDNMKEWLDIYAEQVAYIQEKDLSIASAKSSSPDKAKIDPLLSSKWNQSEPFNNSCPDFFSYGKSVTGCVATAMAQVLYQQYQQNKSTITQEITQEIPAYSCATNWNGSGQISVSAVQKASKIDWENMIDDYTSATDTQKEAVANLMAWCGASVSMNYANADNGGSSASVLAVPQALINYFGFDNSTTAISREAYSTEDWNDRVYEELAAKRAVLYGGQSKEGSGHAFVIHGYEGNNYFDVNWGWGGYGDGAFLLSVLAPNTTGIGAGTVADGYNQGMQMVVNAEPDHGGSYVLSLMPYGMTFDGKTLSCTVANYSNETNYFDLAFAIKTDEGLTQIGKYKYYNIPKPAGQGFISVYLSSDLSSCNLEDGTYTIVPVGRIHDTSSTGDWQNLWSPTHYMQVTVKDGAITAQEMPSHAIVADGFVVGDTRKTGLTCTITATIKNVGTELNAGTVYLFASKTADKGSYVASADINVAAGETETLPFGWIPTEEGTYTLWLSDDDKGNNVLATCDNVVIEKGVVIEEGILTVKSITVNGCDEGQTIDSDGRIVSRVNGKEITGAYTLLVNEAISSKDVFVSLFKYDESTGNYSEVPRIQYSWRIISSSAGNTFNIDFSFTDLDDGKYKLKIAAGTFNKTSHKIDPEDWSNDTYCYELCTTTGMDNAVKAADADVVVYNINGMRVGTAKASAISGYLDTLPKGIYVVGGKKVVRK